MSNFNFFSFFGVNRILVSQKKNLKLLKVLHELLLKQFKIAIKNCIRRIEF